jgi:preprotein translocase subunit SecE
VSDTDEGSEVEEGNESSGEVEVSRASTADSATKKGQKSGKAKKSKKSGDRSANPFLFIYNYLKQVVAEMRKVIWPNRKQMLTYTSVVLGFLAFMVALVGLTDFGLTKLVLLVFG